MNTLLSYFELVDANISGSEKDLPELKCEFCSNLTRKVSKTNEKQSQPEVRLLEAEILSNHDEECAGKTFCSSA